MNLSPSFGTSVDGDGRFDVNEFDNGYRPFAGDYLSGTIQNTNPTSPNPSGAYVQMGTMLIRYPFDQLLDNQPQEDAMVPHTSGGDSLFQSSPASEGYGGNVWATEYNSIDPLFGSGSAGLWGGGRDVLPSSAEQFGRVTRSELEGNPNHWLDHLFLENFSEGSHPTNDVRSSDPNEDALSLDEMLIRDFMAQIGLPDYPNHSDNVPVSNLSNLNEDSFYLNNTSTSNGSSSVDSTPRGGFPKHVKRANNILEVHSDAFRPRRCRRPSPSWVPDGPMSIQDLFRETRGTLWAQDFSCQWQSCHFSTSRQLHDKCESYLNAVYHHIEMHVNESHVFLCKWKGCVPSIAGQRSDRGRSTPGRRDRLNHLRHMTTHLAWYYFCAGCVTLCARYDLGHCELSSQRRCRRSDEAIQNRAQEAPKRFGDLQKVTLAHLYEFLTGSLEVKSPR